MIWKIRDRLRSGSGRLGGREEQELGAIRWLEKLS